LYRVAPQFVNLHKLGHLGHPSQKTGQHPTHLAVLSDETVYLSAGAADMKIREIMTTDVTTAELTSTLEEIATIMRHEDVGAVPIIDDGELAGIVTDRDIVVRCIAEGRDPGESCAEDILTGGLLTVSVDDDISRAVSIMSRNQVRRLPVLDGDGLVGMVSLGDIAVRQGDDQVSGSALEEISEVTKRPFLKISPKPNLIVPMSAEDSIRSAQRAARRGE